MGDFDYIQFTGFSNVNKKCKFVTPRGDSPFDERVNIKGLARLIDSIMKKINVKSKEYTALRKLIQKPKSTNVYRHPSAIEIVEYIKAILYNYYRFNL